MKVLVGIALAGFACGLCSAHGGSQGASDQDSGGLKHTRKGPVAVDGSPVTRAEAQASFARVVGLYKALLHVNVAAPKMQGSLLSPITRAEVVAEMVRLYKAAQPVFAVTPKPVKVDAARLKIDVPSERPGLVWMIERGCVGNYGVLATGKAKTLSVQDFGDSLGFFLSRIGECTGQPSSKWTPYLHAG